MVLISVKNLHREIENKSISMKQFVIYCFISMGSIVSIIRTTRYPVNISRYHFTEIISLVPIIINILKYYLCYRIVKNRDIQSFLYAVVPLNAVLIIRYGLFLLVPLTVLSTFLVRLFKLETVPWTVFNAQIITIVYSVVLTVRFLTSLKKTVKESGPNDFRKIDVTV